jgi:hypothetical protein
MCYHKLKVILPGVIMKLKMKLSEPTSSRYLYVNPKNNHVHVLMPLVSGMDIGLDNTCKSALALQEFFGKNSDHPSENQGVLQALNNYKEALMSDLRDLSTSGDYAELIRQKIDRLKQVERYINALSTIQTSPLFAGLTTGLPDYPQPVKSLLEKPSNLYHMVLRPEKLDDDRWLHSVNPVFSVQRTGTQSLYHALHDAYATLTPVPPGGARERLIKKVLCSPEAQAKPVDFEGLQRVLNQQTKALFGIDIDFNHSDTSEEITEDFINQGFDSTTLFIRQQRPEDMSVLCGNYLLIEPHQLIYIHRDGREEPISISDTEEFQNSLKIIRQAAFDLKNKALPTRLHLKNPDAIQLIALSQKEMSSLTGYTPPSATSKDYIESLLGYCANSLFDRIPESPFSLIRSVDDADSLLILTQFYLAELNLYCAAEHVSTANFGVILDASPDLSDTVAAIVISALNSGVSVESALCNFINENQALLELNRDLRSDEVSSIEQNFISHYAQIKASDHFDEFTVLDIHKPGLFVAHQGAICTDISEVIAVGFPELNSDYFEATREDFKDIHGLIEHQNQSVATAIEVDIVLDNINSAEQLMLILKRLDTPKDRIELLQQLTPKLPDIIQDGDQLATVLNALADPASKTALLAALSANISTLIQDGAQLADVLRALADSASKTALMTNLNAHLPAIIQDVDQLVSVLRALADPKLKTELMINLSAHLPAIIHEGWGLARVLDELPDPESKIALITALSTKLPYFFWNIDQLKATLRRFLDIESKIALMATLSPELPTLIQSDDDFASIFEAFPTRESKIALMTALGAQLPNIIWNIDRLIPVLYALGDPESQTALFTKLSMHLSTLIQNVDQLADVLYPLHHPESKTALMTALSEQLPLIIRNVPALVRVFNALPELELQTALMTSLREHLPTLQWGKRRLIAALTDIPTFESKVVFMTALSPQLKFIIWNRGLLMDTLKDLSDPDSKKAFVNAFSTHLPGFISNRTQLLYLLEELPDAESKITLLTALTAEFSTLVEDGYGFAEVLRTLPDDKSTTQCINLFSTQIPGLIKDEGQLIHVLQALPHRDSQKALTTALNGLPLLSAMKQYQGEAKAALAALRGEEQPPKLPRP